ncbi:phage holin family protein [Mycobacterium sp.]|uniref:phage holin family protein n=1 Tax=Mycobacterium sp. TaxID=1785 RepID=UPI0025F0A1F5|nr:phage holin family protein [Mycobacterium sp.]
MGSWALGLLVAASVVPRVSMSAAGFLVAVAVFSVAQALLSVAILKLPHGYASLVFGGTGLVLTAAALSLACALTHGLRISGMPSWVAATVVVWLVTTIGAVLPEMLVGDSIGSP